MANTFTPELINALATVSALTPDEQSSLVQALIALGRGTANTVSAPTQEAPVVEAPAPTPVQTAKQSAPKARKLEDTVVYVELNQDGKAVEFLYAPSSKGIADRVIPAHMSGVKTLIKDVVLEWDKALLSKDTYRVYGRANFGEHKHGAYRLMKDGKALTKAQTEAWVKAHPQFVLTAEHKAEYLAGQDAKKAKREAKERAQYERLQKKFG